MPIRFRCVYCDKLLGIARRKAGSVVNCPQCNQPLIVPTPEPEPAQAAAAAAGTVSSNPAEQKLFERDDFAELLQADATVRAPESEPRAKRSKKRRESSPPLPPQPFPVERSLPTAPIPSPYQRKQPSGGIFLSKGKLALMLLVMFILIGLAFGGGVVVGRIIQQ